MSRISSSELLLQTLVEGAVLKAVDDLGGPEGASFIDIVRYISIRGLVDKTLDTNSFYSCLNRAVEKGLVSKLSNGKYKLKETPRRRRSSSRAASRRKSKRRSRSKNRSSSRRRTSSSSGRRRKRSSSGKERKRSPSKRRRSRRH